MILVLNCGSLSIKFKLFRLTDLKLIKKGRKSFSQVSDLQVYEKELGGILKSLDKFEIRSVGHRVVHGGPKYRKPCLVSPALIKEIKKYSELAPLHNPFNLAGIKKASTLYDVPQIVCFDTEFFQGLPPQALFYPLPYKICQKFSIFRFGFHGLSHEYVAQQTARRLKKPLSSLNLITCHLGGGSSITAIKKGKAIDTSMGFSPLEGLMMMTRAGDIDVGILLYLAKRLSFKRLKKILNYDAGIKGFSGISADMREVVAKIQKSNSRAKLALDIYIYRLQKYIGAYLAILGKCDALVFTGAIGYKGKEIRDAVVKNFSLLKNIPVLAIKTNEELLIAQKIKRGFPEILPQPAS